MKVKLLTLFVLFYSFKTIAQITKTEAFTVGTKITFYPNQCGNSIPEATDKLTFCDNSDNLGVVERSYGLNDRGVRHMLPNYYNNDEYYVTREGLSIRNVDGTWENIPNIAIPTYNTQGDWTNTATIRNGLVLPDGKVIIQASNANYGFNIYDRVQKTLSPVNFPNNRYPYLFAYDATRGVTWIIAYGGGANGRYLFSYDGASLTPVIELTTAGNVSASVDTSTLIYNDDHLYIASINGLFKINVTNFATTPYNSSTTPSLPFDRVNDLQFDTNGYLWLAISNGSSDGGIVKFDVAAETYDMYQLVSETNAAVNYAFQNVAISDNDEIWVNASNYSGLMELSFTGNTPNWDLLPLSEISTLNFPMTYNPSEIYFRNNQFYFTSIDFSSGSTSNYEVLINANDIWSGRNDNEDGNLSNRMNRRFTYNMPDNNGGVWWFNGYDDVVIYRDANDEHQTIDIENLSLFGVVDDDDNAIVRGGSPIELKKINFPNATSFQTMTNQATDMKRVADQIWVFDRSNKRIDVYKDDAFVISYNLDEDWYQNANYFAIDDNADVWFMRYTGTLEIKKFNITTLSSTTYDLSSVGSFTPKKIVAAPNGGVWFLGPTAAVYEESGVFYEFKAADYVEIYNLKDIVIDTNGKAYLLTNDNASITTIENPTDVNPTLTNVSLENANSVMPALDHYRPTALAIDSEGSLWTHASVTAFKLIDNDLATEYISYPEVLSIATAEIEADINIYPNPVNSKIYVASNQSISRLQLFDVVGKQVASVRSKDNLDVSHLKSGMYILKIDIDSATHTQKIIIN
ncbi:T9SS type A sorting domain-containing protein [Winogradskyella echinorum]|uniref:T9SS type A sorting domain-containing protein n=1 Tax=Winogradskyella echinorum TaxID=538189 RepID=A0ABR6XZV6_9FLAO|nr:T9SS type A sorting domain-containing protein [Winogradskyella echinorum]MBC3846028.1 T9SS type A sorting domain-containing protein [Winogradskyella echinorum]MBC5750376.1 T9SS type A sorting domain-containing protein [Winogradskyella echinorum]